MSVGAVFVFDVPENEIAVAAPKGHRAVIGVLALSVYNGHARRRSMQRLQLREERFMGVCFFPIRQGIPFVAPPLVHLVHRKRHILVIHRDDLFPGEITRAMVQIEKIPKHQAPLPTAIGAIHRIQKIPLFIERSIHLIEGKCLAAGSAGRRHQ